MSSYIGHSLDVKEKIKDSISYIRKLFFQDGRLLWSAPRTFWSSNNVFQALIDCSWGFGNNGCDGGEEFRAYQWIHDHGLPSEDQYGPYIGQVGTRSAS